MKKANYFFAILLISLFSCTDKIENKTHNIQSNSNKTEISVNNSRLQEIARYFSDSLLMGNKEVLKDYLAKYQTDTCGFNNYTFQELKENFEGVRIIKNIKDNSKKDTVFVVPPFNLCDDGESYCFFDKSIPRLLTDSYCCHPDNLFVTDDIDEDGINEIGIYYSSCVGRYKSIRIYSLKQNSWKEIAASTFDILTQDPAKVKYNKLVKKQGKNRFEICNIEDGQIKWKTVLMK